MAARNLRLMAQGKAKRAQNYALKIFFFRIIPNYLLYRPVSTIAPKILGFDQKDPKFRTVGAAGNDDWE